MKDFTELQEFPGYFIAHSPARLMRERDGTYIVCSQTPNSSKDNYWTTTLKTKDGRYVKRSMHRLLMQTFVPNPDNKAHVNHIDGDKSNNELSNLEWATPQENVQHAIELGLTDTTKNRKEIHQYFLDGTYIQSFDSDVAAQESTGIPKQNISKASLGKRKHAGYYQWSREKLPSLTPVTTKYIEYYTYQGKVFNTLTELAEFLGLSHPSKVSFSRFSKEVKSEIQVSYYK